MIQMHYPPLPLFTGRTVERDEITTLSQLAGGTFQGRGVDKGSTKEGYHGLSAIDPRSAKRPIERDLTSKVPFLYSSTFGWGTIGGSAFTPFSHTINLHHSV